MANPLGCVKARRPLTKDQLEARPQIQTEIDDRFRMHQTGLEAFLRNSQNIPQNRN